MAKSEPTVQDIANKLNALESTIKLNYSFTGHNNPNIKLSDKESNLVVKIDEQINLLQSRLDKKLKNIVPSFINNKEKEKLKAKISQYQELHKDILFVESELNNIKEVIRAHGDKIESSAHNTYEPNADKAKKELISKFNTTIQNGIERLKKHDKIDNKAIKDLVESYKAVLEKANDPDVKHGKKAR
jgi:hypothetical protein